MTPENDFVLLLTNLMRGLAARLGALLEVALINFGYNLIVTIIALCGLMLVTIVKTPRANIVALYLAAAAMVMAAKGAELMHGRKWPEYAQMEMAAQTEPGAWINHSVSVKPESRKTVGIINVMGVAAFLLPILYFACSELWSARMVLPTLPPMALLVFATWAYIVASKQ